LRVLAIAYREVASAPTYTCEDERDLVLAGVVAFVDPVLDDAAEAIADLRRDGVVVKISPATTIGSLVTCATKSRSSTRRS
jgi:Mg2+-importing ATPase